MRTIRLMGLGLALLATAAQADTAELFDQVNTRLEAGKAEEALSLLGPATPEDDGLRRTLRAEVLFQAGRFAEAVPVLEDLLVYGAPLSDRTRLQLGQALRAMGRHADAAAVLRDIGEDSRYHDEAGLLRAESLLLAGEVESAEALLAGLQEGPELAARRVLAGKARLSLGQPDAARQDFLEAVLVGPLTPASVEAARALETLDAGVKPVAATGWGRLASHIGRTDTGLRLGKVGQDRALGPDAPVGAVVDLIRGQLLVADGFGTPAIPLLARAAHRASEPQVALRARFALAEATETRGRLSDALRAWKQLAAAHPGAPLSAEALLRAGDLGLRLDQHEATITALESLLVTWPVHPARPRVLYNLGWSHLRLGHHGRAAEFFDAAAREAPRAAAREHALGAGRVVAAARALYWAGRARQLAGETEAARNVWRQLVVGHPLSYYSGLALEQVPALAAERFAHASAVESQRPSPRVARADAALRLGWRAEAIAELKDILIEPGQWDAATLLASAEVFEALGNGAAVRALTRAAVVHHGGELAPVDFSRALTDAFPRYHRELIEAEAKKRGYAPWLLYGLILRESGFISCAKSKVGAKGLTQLMGPTAQDAAADLNLPPPTPERLCDPDYNVTLGAWHLKKLMRRYDGREALVLAAYNAGPGSVDRWLREADRPLDIFVEEIPFDETRVYVRVVLSAALGYKTLAEGVSRPRETASTPAGPKG